MENKIIERLSPIKGQEWIQNLNETIIKQALLYSKNKIILDAGCGSGLTEKFLSPLAKRIDAYDISKEAINFAKKNFYNKNTYFKIKDFNKNTFKKKFYDLVVSIEVIEHLKRYDFYIKNIYNSLKTNGIIVLSTPNKNLTTFKNPYHVKEFSYQEIISLLKKNNLQLIKSIGISSNYISKISNKYIPAKIINLIKKIPFYFLIIRFFCNFKQNNKDSKKSEIIVYICKKNKK